MLIFDTPPLQNHCFWVPMEAKMEATWGLKSIFIAIENDDEKWCYSGWGLIRGGIVNPSVRMKFWAQTEEGFREELASDTKQDLQWRGRRIFVYPQ